MIWTTHNAAMLEMTVDTGRLFSGDECYQLYIELVAEHVEETRAELARRVE